MHRRFALLLSLSVVGCGASERIPLRVELGTRGLSKLPFVIAYDQGLYEKHGLDVSLTMPPPEFEGGRQPPDDLLTRLRLRRRPPAEILVDGAAPMILDRVTNAEAPEQIAIASNDCLVRYHIIARNGIASLEELERGRVGVSAHLRTTTSFIALLLAERMGWDPVQDVSVMRNGRKLDFLKDGTIDAVVANERTFAAASRDGFTVLADTVAWNEPIAGNSVRVERQWLEEAQHREAARRFLKAAAEGLAWFHTRPELALDVLEHWYGLPDRQTARVVYERGATFSRKPYPCTAGIRRTMELYDSNEMRRYDPEDFYDDSLVRELDESGFLDGLYEELARSTPGEP